MKKAYKSLMAALLVGILAGPYAWVDGRAAVSGHYTDMLPNPSSAAGFTSGTLIFNGYDWQMAPLATSQTNGDALSRAPYTGFQSTSTVNITATTAVTTFTAAGAGTGFVGSTTFPANWVAIGRSFRITARGRYTTTSGQQAWTWGLNIGTTTVVTSSTPVTISVASQPFTVSGLFTIFATGNTGTVSGGYDIFATTAPQSISNGQAPVSNVLSYSSYTASAQTVDLTSQLTINPVFNWGASSQGNNILFDNIAIEFLN